MTAKANPDPLQAALLEQQPLHFHSMYGQLRKMAQARLRRHATFTLLDTTALLHESYLRIARAGGLETADEPAFLAYVGAVMRSVIVDVARTRLAMRHGGGHELIPLDDNTAFDIASEPAVAVIEIHKAVEELERSDPRLSKVVALHYFAGMTEHETAVCLGVSERTVRRDIQRAVLLLRVLLS